MRPTPSWKLKIKDLENYNPCEDGVVGDFDTALRTLLLRVKEKEGVFSPTLLEWDSLRGNGWFTSTRRELYGILEEDK